MANRRRYRSYRIYLPLTLVCLAPFLLGSVFPLVVVLLILGLLLSLGVDYYVKRGIVAPAPSYGLLAVLLVALFGLLPLPTTLLQQLSPVAASTRDFVLDASSWAPLSLDLPATVLGALLSLAILLAFLSGVSTSTRKDRWLYSLSLIGGLGGLMVLVIGAHELNEIHSVYLFYPTQAKLTGPLINPNNVAALCSFSALIALGIAWHTENQARMWLFASAVLSVCILPFTGSRGGIAAFVIGLAALLLWELRAKFGTKIAIAVFAAGSLLLVGAILLWGEELEAVLSSDIKFAMWRDTTQLANDFSWVGTGRGAFSGVFPRYQSFPESFTVRSAEMLPLSIVSETGLLGLLASSVFIPGLVRSLWSREIAPAERGAIVAFFAALLHDLADFSLDIAGVALPVFFVAGVLCARQENPRRRPFFIVVATLAALIIPAAFSAMGHTRERGINKIEAAKSLDEVKAITERELTLRPSEGYLALAASARLLVLQEPKAAMAFINRARYLLPNSTLPHLLAARALRKLGRLPQARIEYRSAFSDGSYDTYREALEISPGEPELQQLIPGDLKRRQLLLFVLKGQNRWRETLNMMWGNLQGQKSANNWSELGELALTIREYDEAEAAAQALKRLSDPRAPSLLARSKLAQQNAKEAREILEESVRRWPKDKALWLQLAQVLTQTNDLDAALSALDTAHQLDPQDASILAQRAKVFVAQGRSQSAIATYKDALALAPRSAEIRLSLAQLFESLGRNRDALIIYRALAEENPSYQKEVDRLRN